MTHLQLPKNSSGSAQTQGELWSARASDWAHGYEADHWALYEHALQAAHVGPGKRVLDVGCGSGVALSRAAGRGAIVTGLDAAPGLIAIARQRLPAADLRVGEMETLPYADESFDVVTGFNSFHYAAQPARALREARRVTRSGGLLAIVTWGAAQDCQAAGCLQALTNLLPPAPEDAPGPFALATPGRLSVLVSEAGWSPLAMNDVAVHWHWPDLDRALRAWLSPALAVQAERHVGLEATRAALVAALAPFQAADGYHLHNKFRCLIARR